MPNENLRDVIENTCKDVLNGMNLTEEQMWQMSVRLSEMIMSESSKEMLNKVREEAKKGMPEDLEKEYHAVFLAGYQCGMGDEQRKK